MVKKWNGLFLVITKMILKLSNIIIIYPAEDSSWCKLSRVWPLRSTAAFPGSWKIITKNSVALTAIKN